jgi:hypothetical protein
MPEVPRRIVAEQPGVPALEPINEPLYDTQTYPLAGTSNLVFFTQGLGGRTTRETNVPIAGALPNPQQFHIYGLQLVPATLAQSQFGAAANQAMTDQATIIDNSFFRLFIGTKNYVEVSTVFIPNGHGLTGAVGTAIAGSATVSVHNGVAHQNNYYDVTVKVGHARKPIHLPPQQNFRCELVFPGPGAVAVTTNVSIGGVLQGGIPMKVFLLGIKWREVQ